jgi:two-component system sensor histidine kinase UhpB
VQYLLQRPQGSHRSAIAIKNDGTNLATVQDDLPMIPRSTSNGGHSEIIASLLVERRNRRRAEKALVKSEAALFESEAALRESHARIRDLAGRLIAAQETERQRIARELHDDVSQRLAGIAITLSGMSRRSDVRQHPELTRMLECTAHTIAEAIEDVRRISHDLHPGILEHAGLVEALRHQCAECAQQYRLRISFRADPTLGRLKGDLAFCLYRVAQEALHNVAKHAHARSVDVALMREKGELTLTITDDGRGFDAETARRQGDGLGLRSIEERVRYIGGDVSITGKLNRGTAVRVRVAFDDAGHAPAQTA